MTLPSPPLLLITDRRQANGPLPDIAEAAFVAGCRWLSLREKDLPQEEQIALLRTLLACAGKFRAKVTLHGEAQRAVEAGAHGVHLTAGIDAANARRKLGTGALIGVSIHTADDARTVDASVVDYAIAGPMFETASKPGYGPALGTEGLARIVKACPAPVIAIGGIDAGNASHCRAAGAAGMAVMGGIMRAKNPADVVTELIGAWAAR